MRQRKLGSHTPPCHRRMVITTLFNVMLAALQRRPVLYHTRSFGQGGGGAPPMVVSRSNTSLEGGGVSLQTPTNPAARPKRILTQNMAQQKSHFDQRPPTGPT